MGIYNTVLVECPKCKTPQDFQSKSGECLLEEYSLENAPESVMEDVNRHAPHQCEECNIWFEVDKASRKSVEVQFNPTEAEAEIGFSLRNNNLMDEMHGKI